MVKADAACITWPSVIEPSRYFGAHRMIGSTGAMKPELDETNVVFMSDSRSTAMTRSTSPSDAVDALPLLLFALDQRDALAVLAQPRQQVAKLGFGLVLLARRRR